MKPSAIATLTPAASATPTPAASGTVLSTTDSMLDTGTATSVDYAAPGTNANVAIVANKAGDSLWQLYSEPWNISSGSGSIDMSYTGTGSIAWNVNLTGLNIAGVNAYPFIFYGGDQWGDQIGGQPPQFPAQLSAMNSLTFDVAYALTGTPIGDIDVLFDEYLIPTQGYTGGSGGALEVEVLSYFNFADGQTCTPIKTFTEPLTVNGSVVNEAFTETFCGPGPGGVVLFYPSGGGYSSGEVSFNMLDFAREAATTAGLNDSWWLAGFEFGTEFGDSATQEFTFTATKLSIEQSLAP